MFISPTQGKNSDILITSVTHQLNYLHILQSGKLGKLCHSDEVILPLRESTEHTQAM